ncbi:gamma-glutamyl-gamma-aminobutyrate hydrolase family protein [soil metagenome]
MRPLILLPSRFSDIADSWRVPVTAVGLPYQQAIVRAGGQPLTVPPIVADGESVDDVAVRMMSRVDALCLPGGPDVDPGRYGATEVHHRVFGVRAAHDELDLALARAAIALGKPLLAICRGHQILNTALGGTLHQHLGDVLGEERAAEHFMHHNAVELVAGSRVAVAMGTERPVGHCVHHQSIATLGEGLVVTAWSGDVIEGVELPDRWVVGVQWPPEDDAADNADQQRLFDGFVAAANDVATSVGATPVAKSASAH